MVVLAQSLLLSWSQEVGRDRESQGLTGSASKMAHLPVCWLVTSVPHRGTGEEAGVLGLGLLVCPHGVILASTTMSNREREGRGSHSAFHDLVSEVV